jgi:signal transduction histidine kinase
MQQSLCKTDAYVYQPVMSPISLAQVFQDIKDIFANNPVSKNRILALPSEFPNVNINTDSSLFLRVIGNMITNAFEETEEGEEVKLWVDILDGNISFCVHNKKPMPATIAKRIFQRNFSTKSGIGRGLGTYSMKLFGEEILGGKIDFTSAEEEGTVFRYSMSI